MKTRPFARTSRVPTFSFAIPATVALLATGGLTACGGGSKPAAAPAPAALDTSTLAPSAKIDTKSDPALATCHNTYKPTSNDQDVASDVAAMAKGCADATKMKKVGDTLKGTLSEKTAPVTFPLSAQAGKCYRIYGMSQSTMQDFDILVMDSSKGLVAQDTTDDVSPVLDEDGKFCFKTADSCTIRASAGAGAGNFALEVWSD
jgi:hypothetical protein